MARGRRDTKPSLASAPLMLRACVPLNSSCPVDHVPDWQQFKSQYWVWLKARSVNMKNIHQKWVWGEMGTQKLVHIDT